MRPEAGAHATRSQRLAALRAAGVGKVMSAADAVQLVRDGDTVATGGFVGIGFAEGLAVALERRFAQQGRATARRAASTTSATTGSSRASSAVTGDWRRCWAGLRSTTASRHGTCLRA